jgi:small subunit ribosomal protein S16
MLVIRLARTGRSKYPTYRIVAADSARATTGRFVAQLGHYNPHTKELVVKREEVEKYLSTGAQPSNTVIKLLLREGVTLPAWAKLKTKAPKPKEVVEETPVEEAPAADETEVTEAEAAEDAASEEVTPETPEVAEERVAEVAEDAAVEIEDEAPSVDAVETAASDEAEVEKAEAVEEASDEVASA